MLSESQFRPTQRTVNELHDANTSKEARESEAVSQEEPTKSVENLSTQIESTTRLFEILSARSDIDHPICTECTDLLLNAFQNRLAVATKERDAYISFLKDLNNNQPTSSEVSKAQASLSASKSSESKALMELIALEEEKNTLDNEISDLEVESLALDDEEQAFWRSRNAFALKLSSLQNQRDALNAAYDHDAQQLERLHRTNVYNDTFCIGHDGFFGTINGLRLGRLPPTHSVDWSEINAAWGNAALLLATVAEKLGFTFRDYKIKPMGSTSKIEKIEYPSPQQTNSRDAQASSSASQRTQPKISSLDLFSSGDLPLARFVLHRRIDAGMVAFLDCVRQLGQFVEQSSDDASPMPSQNPSSPRSDGSRDPGGGGARGGGLKLPYPIRKDKIGDVSIKLSVSQDEAWTKACKYALTCCKFLLAHASFVVANVRT